MKKECFKYLYSFKYKNKDYIYLISKNYPFYFLEYNYNTKRFDYPDITIFKELYDKFYSNSNFLFFDKSTYYKKIKEKLYNLNININPFVRTTSGVLSVALAISMYGCTHVTTNDVTNNNTSSSVIEMQDNSKEIYNYFKNYNMEVVSRLYDGNDYIFVNNFINSKNKKEIYINNYDEFRKLKNIDFIPNFDDVIDAFNNNKNIDDDKKSIILDCINNMRSCNELKMLDLSVLYVNAKRMKFEYISSEEIVNTVGRKTSYAYFDAKTGTVYLPNDVKFEKFIFIHEVLGHGSLAFREETEDCLYVFDYTNYLMLFEDNRYVGYSFGNIIDEGGANIIAHLATNDYSVDNFYQLFEEELRVIAELCNISIGELLNLRGIELYDLMYKNKINTPVEYIFKMDGIFKGNLYCEFSSLMERLFVDATTEDYINSSDEQKEKIINDTTEIIRNTHLKKEKLHFKYDNGSIDYDFEEAANKYEENMNKLK